MIAFWVAAGLVSAAAAGLILQRAAQAATSAGSPDPTMAVYRRQLDELDDLAATDRLPQPELRAAKAEAARRLLAAADSPESLWSADRADRPWILVLAAAAAGLALVVYLALGSPGQGDQPMEQRIAQWRGGELVQLSPAQLAAVLKYAVARSPEDVEGLRFLGLAELRSGNTSGAVRALRRALALSPERADLWELLGDSLVAQADGDESPAAQAAFRQALARNPKAFIARFHLARALALAGDRAAAQTALRALQADMPADDPRQSDLSRVLAELAAPPKTSAPARPNLQMIRGMVAGLAARLAAQPDDPEGWIRLVRSYAVLGDPAARDAALAKARARFASRPDVARRLDEAARAEPLS